MRRILRTAFWLIAYGIVGQAIAQTPPPAAPAPFNPNDERLGERLDGETLLELFRDRELKGCYIDGRPAWHELTREDGALIEFQPSPVEVGVWWIDQDAICYFYTDGRGGPSCFFVLEKNGALDFYGTLGDFLASTLCKPRDVS